MILYTWVCVATVIMTILALFQPVFIMFYFYGLNGKMIQLLLVPHYEDSLLKKKLHQVWSWAHSHTSVFHLIYKGKKEREKTKLVSSFICHSSKDYTFHEKILYSNKNQFFPNWSMSLLPFCDFHSCHYSSFQHTMLFSFWPVSF